MPPPAVAAAEGDIKPAQRSPPTQPFSGGAAAMRLIVPLQGVVQGRGGLFLGSVIPCALFYFLQLYLKRNRPPSTSSSSTTGETNAEIPRTLSRTSLLSPRGSSVPAYVSFRAAAINRADEPPPNRSEDRYHPVDNPHGVIELRRAENKLSQDLIQDKITSNLRSLLMNSIEEDLGIGELAAYQPFDGLMELKIALAGFMSQVMQGSVSFDPSQMILTSGARSAIEILSFCLADPGNAFLVPSPYYPGYDNSFKWRSGVDLIPVPCRSTDNFVVSTVALERAYNQAKKRGIKVRGVLLTNPSNPVGNLLNKDMLYDILDFVTEKNIHLICDEVFAGSTYGNDFVSMADVIGAEGCDRNRVHIVYGLSKDLCLPGFRVGVIYTFNDNVLAAARKLARFSSVSVPTQRLLISILSDTNFVAEFVNTNKERLFKMYGLFVDGLKQLGINCIKSSGGFYCWADMSKFMRSYSEKGEIDLWERLSNVAKVNVLPGSSCHCIEPGWFRFCFTTLTEDEIMLVMSRIKRVTGNDRVPR